MVWDCTTHPHIAVNILLGTSFIDRFIREIFPAKRKAVLWHSNPVAILSHQWSPAMATAHILSPAQRDDTPCKAVFNEFTTSPVRVARQIIFHPNTTAQVLVTTSASESLVIQPHLKCLYRQKTFTTRGIMIIPPRQPFYVTISSFSHRAQPLLTHMMVAHTEPAPPTIYRCRQNFETPPL